MKVKDYLFIVLILGLLFFLISNFLENKRLVRLIDTFNSELESKNQILVKKVDSLILDKKRFVKREDSLIKDFNEKEAKIIYINKRFDEVKKVIVNTSDADSLKSLITKRY